MTLDQPVHAIDSPRPSLRIDVHGVNRDTVVIQLCGELDRATAPALTLQLRRLLGADASCATVIIDMAGTSFLDVGGLNTLLDVHRRANVQGIAVCLTRCTRQVLQMLQATRTAAVLKVVPGQSIYDSPYPSEDTGSSAHTDLPSSNSLTPHRAESADTTCNPRPRRAWRSIGRGRGGRQR